MGFETFAAELLLRVIPDPIVWALVFLIGVGVIFAIWKLPASVTAPSISILIFTMNQYLGGIFNILNMVILVVTGVLLVAGVLKLGSR